jgi:hypothetical protein
LTGILEGQLFKTLEGGGLQHGQVAESYVGASLEDETFISKLPPATRRFEDCHKSHVGQLDQYIRKDFLLSFVSRTSTTQCDEVRIGSDVLDAMPVLRNGIDEKLGEELFNAMNKILSILSRAILWKDNIPPWEMSSWRIDIKGNDGITALIISLRRSAKTAEACSVLRLTLCLWRYCYRTSIAYLDAAGFFSGRIECQTFQLAVAGTDGERISCTSAKRPTWTNTLLRS